MQRTLIPLVVSALLSASCHSPTEAIDGSSVSADTLAEAGPAASAKADAMSFRDLAELVGARCGEPDTGKDCISGNPDHGDFQKVELRPECGETGMYGYVMTKGAAVMNRTPPNDTLELAKFTQGLKVCVQAIAREGETNGYYFVTPVDCSSRGDSGSACISGWMDAADLNVTQ